MSISISLPNSLDCKVILPNACWVEIQDDTKDSIALVSVPCDDMPSVVVIDANGKRNELCFSIGSIIKIENHKLFYDKSKLEECESIE